jgi:hypothetical protein
LETGIPSEAVGLLDLPVLLTRGDYLNFYNRGILTVDDVIKTPRNELSAILGVEMANKLLTTILSR